jgi:hypothetical protein
LDNDCDGHIDEGCNPPEYDVIIELNNDPVEICFAPDNPLNTDPIVTLAVGSGVLIPASGSTVPPVDDPCQDIQDGYLYCVYYTVDGIDTEVEIHIDEDPDFAVVDGYPGFGIASFNIDTANERASSFYLYNDAGGIGYLIDNLCNESVSVEIAPGALDLSGLGANPGDYVLVEIAEVNPTGIPATYGTDVKIYDIALPDGVEIAAGQTMLITLDFEIPLGMSQQEFLDNFNVMYYDKNMARWDLSVISNVTVNFDTMDITFTTTRPGMFVASYNNDGGSVGGDINLSSSRNSSGSGVGVDGWLGCSLVPGTHNNMTGLSAIANAGIFLLLLIAMRIKKRRDKE